MDQPTTRYANNGDLRIAYQVLGDGPLDLVVIPGIISNVDVQWLDPAYVRAVRRLAGFARVITMDKRGTGMSDPAPTVPTLEERVDDVRAVMDAAGCQRAVLLGFSEGGATAVMTAATHPDRVSALVMVASVLDGRRDPERRPWWEPAWEAFYDIERHWGEGRLYRLVAPSHPQTQLSRRLAGLFERASASPAMLRALVDSLAEIDVSDIAPHVRVPTLILHREGDRFVPVQLGREIARAMPHARYVELPGDSHIWYFGDVDGLIDEIERFVTGGLRETPKDRVLASVLFTDIVGSTERAAEEGDRAWLTLLDRHREATERAVEAARGRVVKWMGDGMLATFEGPGRALDAARATLEAAAESGIALRAGVHTGECELLGDDIGGMAVNIGARISSLARPGEVLLSGTVRDLVTGSGHRFTERGVHALKGVPGEWRLYALDDGVARVAVPAHDTAAPPLGSRVFLSAARFSPRLATGVVRYSRRRRGAA